LHPPNILSFIQLMMFMKVFETSNVVKIEEFLILLIDFASVGKRNVQEEDSSLPFIPLKMGAVHRLETQVPTTH